MSSFRSVFRPGLFRGQVIVVTGGGSGIGRCTAHELAALGAHVVLLGRKLDKLQHVASEIVADGEAQGDDRTGWRFEIKDSTDQTVMTMPFSAATTAREA